MTTTQTKWKRPFPMASLQETCAYVNVKMAYGFPLRVVAPKAWQLARCLQMHVRRVMHPGLELAPEIRPDRDLITEKFIGDR